MLLGRLQTITRIPVIEFPRYWLACSASEIYAARSSIVGSIGVIGGGFGFVEVAEKIGVRNGLEGF